MSFQLYDMATDLGITDKQYLIALTVFFFPYALLEVRGICVMSACADLVMQPASNVVLRRIRPSVWLSSMMFVWGIVMVCFRSSLTSSQCDHSRQDVPRISTQLWRARQ
jgi:hypothetical protein